MLSVSSHTRLHHDTTRFETAVLMKVERPDESTLLLTNITPAAADDDPQLVREFRFAAAEPEWQTTYGPVLLHTR